MNGNGRSALFCREPACSGNPRRVSGMEIRQRTGHLGIGAAGELSVLSADITNGLRKRQSETNATNDHETCRPILIHTRSKTLLIAGNAGAGSTTRSTNTAGMEFVAANIGINDLTADSTSGQARTLLFTADASSVTGFPYKIDCGDFLLICAACTTTPTTIFDGFTFDLAIDNTTHGAIGEFVGTSSPGAVSGNTRTIVVSRVPLPPGPGTGNPPVAVSTRQPSAIWESLCSLLLIPAIRGTLRCPASHFRFRARDTGEVRRHPAHARLFGRKELRRS